MAAHDLFAWRDEADAARAVAMAEGERAVALKRHRLAPLGTRLDRERHVREATVEALRAEVALQRAQADER